MQHPCFFTGMGIWYKLCCKYRNVFDWVMLNQKKVLFLFVLNDSNLMFIVNKIELNISSNQTKTICFVLSLANLTKTYSI